jgi:hypothetical protein
MVKLLNELQHSKAEAPIAIADSGMTTRTRQRHEEKASGWMLVTVSGMQTSSNLSTLQPDASLLTHSIAGLTWKKTCARAQNIQECNGILISDPWALEAKTTSVPKPKPSLALALRATRVSIVEVTYTFPVQAVSHE